MGSSVGQPQKGAAWRRRGGGREGPVGAAWAWGCSPAPGAQIDTTAAVRSPRVRHLRGAGRVQAESLSANAPWPGSRPRPSRAQPGRSLPPIAVAPLGTSLGPRIDVTARGAGGRLDHRRDRCVPQGGSKCTVRSLADTHKRCRDGIVDPRLRRSNDALAKLDQV